MHRYFPHTPGEIDAMLARCGVASLDELYADVPESLRMKAPYALPAEMSEIELREFFDTLGAENRQLECFAGAGFYNHYTPAIIPQLISRSEFLTAYTPYQPEISQGTLQYIFEYQTMIAALTGMEVSNASMYDGATATAEAMMMAVSHARRRNRVLISATLNPDVRRVVDTYGTYHGITIDTIPATDGVTDLDSLREMLADGDVAGVILSQPNYFGIIEDLSGVADICHAAKSLLILNCIASDLGVLRTPTEWGADIVCGDAQSLGIPLSFGGPYLGYLATSKALMRKLPGRIVGATTDAQGRRVFVLTLQAREQHIRRDKATSNICSNQGLMALFVTIYLSALGADGLRKVCLTGAEGARYLAERLTSTGKMQLTYPGHTFLNEFLMTCTCSVDALIDRCADAGILAGVKVDSDKLLIAVTELNSKSAIDKYVDIVSKM